MKIATKRNRSLPDLCVTYDPPTQRGLVLRLQKRLNHVFDLRFLPAAGSGTEENGKGPSTPRGLLEVVPADILFMITTALATDPSPSGAQTLFALAATSKGARAFLEDWEGLLEAVTSKILLGVSHTRTREDRRLGLVTDVAQRYGWVLAYIKRNAEPLQDRATENLALYQEYGAVAYEGEMTQEKVLKVEPMINPWPWWYLRLLSNWKTKQLVTSETGMGKMDHFAASIVSISGDFPKPRFRRLPPPMRRETRFDTGTFQRGVLTENKANRRRFRDTAFERGSAGADLVVIDLDEIYRRALLYYWRITKVISQARLDGRIGIRVHLDDVFLSATDADDPDPFDANAFQKEVEILGGDSFLGVPLEPEEEEEEAEGTTPSRRKKRRRKPSHIEFGLFIRGAFVSSRSEFMRFLRTFHRQKYLRDSQLSLQYIHFQGIGRGLDLRKASARGAPGLLDTLNFGPANTPLAPRLACPSPGLGVLTLTAPFGRTMEWRMHETGLSNVCFPKLHFLELGGDLSIWDPTTLAIIGASPDLDTVHWENFSRSSKEMREFLDVLAELSGKSESGIEFSYSYADESPLEYDDVPFEVRDQMRHDQRLHIRVDVD